MPANRKPQTEQDMSSGALAAVVIGRNEGERLVRCLASLAGHMHPIIYVDSGSTDGSVAAAEAAGADVVALDMDRPFTAARARNAGLARLDELSQGAFVQVIDGDCELDPQWPQTALDYMKAHEDVAAVAGRLRERFADATLWNRLADREWDTPIGEISAIGGIAILRRAAIADVGGYRETLIAGEEPEMCLRLRRKGWKIWRLDADMAQHDIAMTRFSQWWRRARRYGHTLAEGVALHGDGPEQYCRSERRRALLWGGLLPLAAIAGPAMHPVFWLLWLLWPAQIFRLKSRGTTWEEATFLTLGKIPQMHGIVEYFFRRRRGLTPRIIEYK